MFCTPGILAVIGSLLTTPQFETLPQEVVAAWVKAGAELDYVHDFEFGQLSLPPAKESPRHQLPAFKIKPGMPLGELPAPKVPFAIFFERDAKRATDVDVLQLARFEKLRAISFWWTQVTDVGLAVLPKLPELEIVDLGVCSVGNDGMAHVAGVMKLRDLSLRSTQVGDAGLAHLAKLPALERLNLYHANQYTDNGLKHIARIKSLRHLDLGSTGVTDDWLKALAPMSGLETLKVCRTKVTNAGMKHLAKLTTLKNLDIYATKVGDEGLRELAPLKNLTELNLWLTQVTDDGLKHLLALENLRTLDLSETKVKGCGFKELAGLKHLTKFCYASIDGEVNWVSDLVAWPALTHLSLSSRYPRRKKITDEGMKTLTALNKLEFFVLRDHVISARGVETLAEIASLKHLYFAGNRVRDDELSALRARFPHIKIAK